MHFFYLKSSSASTFQIDLRGTLKSMWSMKESVYYQSCAKGVKISKILQYSETQCSSEFWRKLNIKRGISQKQMKEREFGGVWSILFQQNGNILVWSWLCVYNTIKKNWNQIFWSISNCLQFFLYSKKTGLILWSILSLMKLAIWLKFHQQGLDTFLCRVLHN